MRKLIIFTALMVYLVAINSEVCLSQKAPSKTHKTHKENSNHFFILGHGGIDTSGYEKTDESKDGVTEYKRVNIPMFGITTGYAWEPINTGFDYFWEAPTVGVSATYIGADAEAVLVGGHFDPHFNAAFPLIGFHLGMGNQTSISFEKEEGIESKKFSQFIVSVSASTEVIEDVGLNVMILTTGFLAGIGYSF